VGPYFLYRTTAVGNYPHGASPFGALDMAGTVWEWCLNDYKNPQVFVGYNNNEYKVLRGGSFLSNQNHAAASYRYRGNPNLDNYHYGLRLVVSAPIASLISGESDL